MITFSLFLSNQLDFLIKVLGDRLFQGRPLARKKVVIPDNLIRNYLLLRLAEDPERKIAMGMELLSLPQAVPDAIPSLWKLSLQIQHLLAKLPEEPLFEPLHRYLSRTEGEISDFCDLLASHFLRYLLYEKGSLNGWQQELWNRLQLSDTLFPQGGGEWHIFGFNHLPPLFTDYFKGLGANFYLLSPCQHYWEDVCSDKERGRLYRHLREEEQETAESYLQDQNPMLANLGKLGRSFLRQLSDIEPEELYEEPKGELRLHKMQRAILSLEPFDPEENEDASLQLFAASSMLSEVELLFSELQTLLSREAIEPREVQVFAPDINCYFPYIQMVFGSENFPLPYSASGLKTSFESGFAKGFLLLLDLLKKRFDKLSVIKLFSNSAFQKKNRLTKEDLEKIQGWIEKASLRWGVDQEQCCYFLKKEGLENNQTGTWEHVFERLLLGMAMVLPKSDMEAALPGVDFSDSELFEKLITLIRTLKKDLKPFLESAPQTATFWARLLKELAMKYFFLDEEEYDLLKEFDNLLIAVKELPDPIFPFSALWKVVEGFFSAPIRSYRTSQLQSIRFSSLPKGSPLPSRVIWLLGMQEGEFPRREKQVSFIDLGSKAPTRTEVDRYLFLELFLSAQDYFLISYQNLSAKDQKVQAPSLLVQELQLTPKIKKTPLHKTLKTSFSPFFSFSPPIVKEQSALVKMKSVEKCAKHPLKFYCNETLDIYLEFSKSQEEEFLLSYPVQAEIGMQSLKKPLEAVLEGALRQGKMPIGRFREIARVHLEKRFEKIEGTAFDYDLQRNPLQVEGRKIVGKLQHLSSEGLLFWGENRIGDLLKVWPSYLVYLNLPEGKEAPNLILLKNRKKVISPPNQPPETLLKEYLDYYEMTKVSFSPLLPDWGAVLLKGTLEEFEKVIKIKDRFSDAYLNWLFAREPELSGEALFAEWSPRLRKLFAPFLEWSGHEV